MACLPNPYKLSILGDIWRAASRVSGIVYVHDHTKRDLG